MTQILCQRTSAAGKALVAANNAEDQRTLLELGTAAIANTVDFAAAGHHANHQHGGSDEIATSTPAANAIPKTGVGGALAIGWLPLGTSSSTVCVGNDSRLSDARTPTDSSVTTAKIVDDQVTFAKLQNLSSQRLVGRQSSSSGNAAEIAVAAGAGIELDWSTADTLTITATGGGGGGSGSVESVGLSLPSMFEVGGSPVTSSGTLSATLADQPANRVLSGPGTGSDDVPYFRSLVAADIPQILRGAHLFRETTLGNGVYIVFDSLDNDPATTRTIFTAQFTASSNSADEGNPMDEGYVFGSITVASTDVATPSVAARITLAFAEIVLATTSAKVGSNTILTDADVGTMAAENASDYTPTSGLGSAAFASTSDFIAAAGLTSVGNDLITASDQAAARAAIGAGAGNGTVTSVAITQPSAGITTSGGPITAAGSITLALANDLAALEGLSSTGYAKRTGTDAWSQVAAIPIADGGTNSTAALNNNRLMKSSSGAIVEMGAMTDGQIVVGVTSAAPSIVSVSGDLTLTNSGAAAIPTSVLSSAARSVTDDPTTGAMLNTLGRPRKNAIINGDPNIAQRGTSFVSPSSQTYSLDRWILVNSSAATVTITQNSDAPSVAGAGRLILNSLRTQITGADTSIAAGDLLIIQQRIEGCLWAHFAQRDLTLSFWVRSGKTGTHTVALTNGIDRSYVSEYTINSADTWEFKTLSIPASPSAGTWAYDHTAGARLSFTLMNGSSWQTTAGSWQSAAAYSTSNQVNVCDSASSRFFAITGVQLEVGSGFSGFDGRSFAEELTACQRYYWKSFPYATAPATQAGMAGAIKFIAGRANNDNERSHSIRHPVHMRSTPGTITFYNVSNNNAQARDMTAGGDCSSTTAQDASASDFWINTVGINSSTQVGFLIAVHAAVDAEI